MLDYSSGHIRHATAAPLVAKLAEIGRDSPVQARPGHPVPPPPGATRRGADQRGQTRHPSAPRHPRPGHRPGHGAFATFPELHAFLRKAHEFLRPTRPPGHIDLAMGAGTPPDLAGLCRTLRPARSRGLGRGSGQGPGPGRRNGRLEVEGVTGLIDTNYEGKVHAALEFPEKRRFRLRARGSPGRMRAHGRRAAQETRHRTLRPAHRGPGPGRPCGHDATIVVTCDHFTPVVLRTHTEDPVPFLVYRTRAPGPTARPSLTRTRRRHGPFPARRAGPAPLLPWTGA
jgi:2,3-bisphosphoglycerate-independent phosphoglycerate mutase